MVGGLSATVPTTKVRPKQEPTKVPLYSLESEQILPQNWFEELAPALYFYTYVHTLTVNTHTYLHHTLSNFDNLGSRYKSHALSPPAALKPLKKLPLAKLLLPQFFYIKVDTIMLHCTFVFAGICVSVCLYVCVCVPLCVCVVVYSPAKIIFS